MIAPGCTLMSCISLNTVAQSQSLDFQERCASQARKAFQEMESDYKAQPSYGMKIVGSGYQSHYNMRLNRCLMLLERSKYMEAFGKFSNSTDIIDANERRG
jgi:hypothetical protein